MSDLTALSSQIIDEGAPIFPVRVNNELSEIAAGVAVVESFSNVAAIATDDGLILSDTSGESTGPAVVESLRTWSDAPFHTILYTHGHIDHVGGAGAFVANSAALGHRTPRFAGHENLPARFERYRLTAGYNTAINKRQFGEAKKMGIGGAETFLPLETPAPDLVFRDRLGLTVGSVQMDLRHSKGETDDHAWAWLPDRKLILPGDLFMWNFPNAGNPQKVQRYPREWAAALREMSGLGAELLVPAHGFPIAGAERIRRVLDDTAGALETLVNDTLAMMNEGARLDTILHTLKLPAEMLAKPYLRALYDEPEFVIHNIWRLYGGWYDGNPAHLKPAADSALAAEVAKLSGGIEVLITRAKELAEAQDFRLACHLIEMAVQAEPAHKTAHGARSEIYALRRDRESSLMARGIFGSASHESEAKL
ncbi:MAG: MBL fold metallo-hydrolase [bacterium]|nr:MBL fold metallo-hydrolase [bacterium]